MTGARTRNYGFSHMGSEPQRHYSVDEYYSVEESSPLKHEFYRGEIFAMAGASIEHLHITANVLTALRGTLLKR